GRARAGSFQSPLWVGGGVVFGPRPRDFSKKVSKKTKQLALQSVDRTDQGRRRGGRGRPEARLAQDERFRRRDFEARLEGYDAGGFLRHRQEPDAEIGRAHV